MKRTSYMNSQEMIDWMKVGISAGELKHIADTTSDATWKKRLTIASKLCDSVLNERLTLLDKEQLKSLDRRRRHTAIKFVSTDAERCKPTPEDDLDVPVQVSQLDIYDLADLALTACYACKQGDVVADCPYRKVFHRLAIPVNREDPKAGECEFRRDNDIEFVIPPKGEIAYVLERNGEKLDKRIIPQDF